MEPALYWRKAKQQHELLGKKGIIMSITHNQANKQWIGIVDLGSKKITAPIAATLLEPKIGDQVVGVVRILSSVGPKDLIPYGIKFQLAQELL
ncbi:hypothetical protein GYA49_02330 [Candidatus Beckwithbacteria bacterium]|nr:hypothetical protein [Candidatus Beckwithbacteria bacterium]